MKAELFGCALLLVSVAIGHDSMASGGACRLQASSYAQNVVSPDGQGDEAFFTRPSGPPSVVFLIGNSGTMQQYPQPLPMGDGSEGCTDPAVVFNPATDGLSRFDPDYKHEFDPDKWYVTWSDQMTFDGDGKMNQYGPDNTGIAGSFADFHQWDHIDDVCGQSDGSNSQLAKLYNWDGTNSVNDKWASSAHRDNCHTCLTNSGWYRIPLPANYPPSVAPAFAGGMTGNQLHQAAWAVSGKFLNKYPPKFAIARKVLKDVVLASGRVRLGLAGLSAQNDLYDPAVFLSGGNDPDSWMEPDCDKAVKPKTDFTQSRSSLVQALNKTTFDLVDDPDPLQQQYAHGLGEALFSLGGFFSSQASNDTWEKWFGPGNVAVSAGFPNSGGSADWFQGPNSARAPYAKSTGKHDSVCFPCQVSSVVIISDSRPNADNTVPVEKMDSDVGFPVNTANSYPTGDPGGINTCVQNCGCPNGVWSGGSADTSVACNGPYNDGGLPDGGLACRAQCDIPDRSVQGPQQGNTNYMDDVAYFLAHQDLREDMTGPQVVNTYTVGLGSGNDPMLMGMAKAGLGKFRSSTNASELKKAILDTLSDIVQQSTSASSASINNIQAGGDQTAFVPRFHPVPSQAFWPGDLLAFTLYNENGTKCMPNGTGDLDNDGSCTGIYFIDANNKRIVPDTSGLIDKSKPGQLYEITSTGLPDGTKPAVPFWSAAQKLAARDLTTRQVFTVLDDSDDVDVTGSPRPGGAVADTPLAFTEDNWDKLLPYLGITDDPSFCDTLASKSGVVEASPSLGDGGASAYETCARLLIKFVRGYDVLNEENLADDGTYPWTNHARAASSGATANPNWGNRDPEIMGDVFHSSPIKISAPANESICRSGAISQCVSTLFDSPTPLVPVGGLDAYQQWQKSIIDNHPADVLVVGANDGMVHVFKADCWYDSLKDPNSSFSAAPGTWPSDTLPPGYQGQGSRQHCGPSDALPGDELFGFIPPDQLSRLKYLLSDVHRPFIDGNPMVRDVWVDGLQSDNTVSAGDDLKQSSEYRTVAIFGERGGGNKFFALDMTDALAYAEGRVTSDPMHAGSGTGASRFLWMFPRNKSATALLTGETWNDYAPAPPPIGPIRVATSDTNALPYGGGKHYREEWAAFLPGGYDALGVRGRGIYFLDAWTGTKLKEFSPYAADATTIEKDNMRYPFAAIPGVLNWGPTDLQQGIPDNQYFFDTATVGDLGGQLWALRFYDPDPTTWTAGRGFQMARDDGTVEIHRYPIFNQTTNVRTNNGYLRTNFGTGDRQHLHDQGVGDCGFGNLKACQTQQCTMAVSASYTVGSDQFTAGYSYNSTGARADAPSTFTNGGTGDCTILNQGGVVVAIGGCPGQANAGPLPVGIPSLPGGISLPAGAAVDLPYSSFVCTTDASGNLQGTLPDGGFGGCAEQQGDLSSLKTNYAPPPLTSATYDLRNRFFSIRMFGTDDGGAGRPAFADGGGAATYDANRLSDFDSSGNPLLPVVDTSSFAFSDGGGVLESGPGWVVPYPVYDERGSGNAVAVAGCLFWNTVQGGNYCITPSDCCDPLPDGGPTTSCGASCTNNECSSQGVCGKLGSSTHFSYSADIITGSAGCGLAFNSGLADGGSLPLRRIACTSNCNPLPPAPPGVVTTIYNNTVSTALVGTPDVPALQVTKADDLVKNLYQLVLPADVHDCRHGNGSACP